MAKKIELTAKKQVPKQLRKYVWQPGVSGNPDGRPEGSVSIVEGFRRKLQEFAPSKDNEEKRTYLELLIETYFKKALNEGDVRIIRDLIDRIDGKPTETINANLKGEINNKFNDKQITRIASRIAGRSGSNGNPSSTK